MPVDWTPRGIVTRTVGRTGDTWWVRSTGRSPDPALRPVVALHGFSGNQTAREFVAAAGVGATSPIFPTRTVDVLCSTGRTVWEPFMGAAWGKWGTVHPTGSGGTGPQGIADAITTALEGTPHTQVDMTGGSGGGHALLLWVYDPARAALVHRGFLSSPGYDLSAAYDVDTTAFGLPPIDVSLRAVLGGTDKATWLPLSAAYDPKRIGARSWRHVGPRLACYSAGDDPLVPGRGLRAFCDAAGIALSLSVGGGHFLTHQQPEYSDVTIYRWLEAGRLEPHSFYTP